MHIGLIGGIGPAATVSYYTRLTAAMRALGQPLELTLVNADAPTLVANNAADNRAAQAEIYATLIARLQRAGADCAAITSLGGHFCFAETVARSPLPLVSGVAPLDAHFATQGYRTVGLLGTAVVMETHLYGQLARTRALAPEDSAHIGRSYTDMAVSGVCTPAQRDLFLDAGRAMMEAGADAVVLAGTDLNLAFDGQTVDYPLIDALDVHVAALVALASGQRTL